MLGAMRVLHFFLLFISSGSFASDCLSPPKSWSRIETTIELEEKKSKAKYLDLKSSFINSGYKEGSEELKTLKKSFLLSDRKDWKLLKDNFKVGDLIFESKAPPLSGPILLCLVRDNELVRKVVVAIQ